MAEKAGKTRDRILDVARTLFNEKGERLVTTNHIADHMGISPGNLYYHFRNKQAIVQELFKNYSLLVEAFLQLPPPEHQFSIDDKRNYLQASLESLWEYRFLHRDMDHLVAADDGLYRDYQVLSHFVTSQMKAIYERLVSSGVMQIDSRVLEGITFNSWLVIVSWIGLAGEAFAGRGQKGLSRDRVRRAIYQLLIMDRPYVVPAFQIEFDQLLDEFYVPLVISEPFDES